MSSENYKYTLSQIYQKAHNLGNKLFGAGGRSHVSSKHTIKRLYDSFERRNFQELRHMVCKIALDATNAGGEYCFKEATSLLKAASQSYLVDEKCGPLQSLLFKPAPHKINLQKCLNKCEEIYNKEVAKKEKANREHATRVKIYGPYRA